MHLVLIREGYAAIHVPDVTLSEGYKLSIGGIEVDTPDIEPAQWFKTLIMDYMTIDCSKRIVKWSTEASETDCKSEQTTRNSHILYSTGEFSDFETQSDELFNSIAEVFEPDGPTTPSAISQLMVRMLHCHILPNVKIDQDDIPKLNEALKKQQRLLTMLEERVDELSKENSQHKHILQKNCNKIIDDLHKDPDDVINFGSKILPILKDHVSQECQRLERELEQLENAVLNAKKEVECCPGDEQLQWDMKRKRVMRDALYEERYLKVVSVRELLSEQLVASQKTQSLSPRSSKSFGHHMKVLIQKRKETKVTTRDKVRIQHDLYVKRSEIKAQTKDKIKTLMGQKVLMTSVKEAIVMTITDLQSKDCTIGLQTKHGHLYKYPTDVLNQTKLPPEWLAFEDQVTEMVTNGSDVVGAKHSAFCQLVITTCQDACREDTYYRMVDRALSEKCWGFQIPEDATSWLCYSSTSEGEGFCDNNATPTRKAIYRLKTMISQHLEEICAIIGDRLQTSSTIKVRIAYETHFYAELSEFLISLYMSAYSDCTKTLQTQAGYLTVEELEITETWILNMLENRRDSGIEMENQMNQTQPKKPLTHTDHKTFEFENLLVTSAANKDDSCDNQPIVDSVSSDGDTNVHVHDDELPENESTESEVAIASWISSDDQHSADEQRKDEFHTSQGSDKSVKDEFEDSFASYSSDQNYTDDNCNDEFYTSGNKSNALPEGNRVHVHGDRLKTDDEPAASENLMKSREFNVQSEKFKHVFDTAYHCLTSLGDENTPLKKMQMLTRCLRAITTTLSKPETTKCQSTVCSDDLIPILQILILNLTLDQIGRLYVELKFINDFMPPFLETGVHCYSAVQLEGAFQDIFTKLMKIKNRKT